jgi:putative alpha-1,2-mannosidase
VLAENNSPDNVFIESIELNGKQLARSWFTHADIVAGGDLRFRMGNRPNKDWASAPADRPPSGLVSGQSAGVRQVS